MFKTRRGTWLVGLCATIALSSPLGGQETAHPVPVRDAREIARFPAPEARQAVAVDAAHFYAIDNRRIGKYEKATGARVGGWEGDADGPIQHLNSGVVIGGRLYAANSNYPQRPMISSIEIWEVETMRHVATHSFGIHAGSGTWIDRRDDVWWVVFANYENAAGEPGRGVDFTVLERYDDGWRRTGGWVFPEALVSRFRPYSNSGGSWGNDGRLYLTGHDEGELYVAELPNSGSTLQWVETIRGSFEGQGMAWDRTRPGVFYGIRRSSREVVVFEIPGS
jgi:hypothetical protein